MPKSMVISSRDKTDLKLDVSVGGRENRKHKDTWSNRRQNVEF